MLLAKTGLDEEEFSLLLGMMLHKVRIVPKEQTASYVREAEELVVDIDPDDAPFLACALAYDAMLWSDDKALKKQGQVEVINTEEMNKRMLFRTS